MATALHFSTPGPSHGLHYHASTQSSSAIVLQRDNQEHTMIDISTSGTDNLIGPYKIESELTNKKKSEQSDGS